MIGERLRAFTLQIQTERGAIGGTVRSTLHRSTESMFWPLLSYESRAVMAAPGLRLGHVKVAAVYYGAKQARCATARRRPVASVVAMIRAMRSYLLSEELRVSTG